MVIIRLEVKIPEKKLKYLMLIISHPRGLTTTAPKDGWKIPRRGKSSRVVVAEGGGGEEGGLNHHNRHHQQHHLLRHLFHYFVIVINTTFVIIILIKVGCGGEVQRHGSNTLHQQVEQGPWGAHRHQWSKSSKTSSPKSPSSSKESSWFLQSSL